MATPFNDWTVKKVETVIPESRWFSNTKLIEYNGIISLLTKPTYRLNGSISPWARGYCNEYSPCQFFYGNDTVVQELSLDSMGRAGGGDPDHIYIYHQGRALIMKMDKNAPSMTKIVENIRNGTFRLSMVSQVNQVASYQLELNDDGDISLVLKWCRHPELRSRSAQDVRGFLDRIITRFQKNRLGFLHKNSSVNSFETSVHVKLASDDPNPEQTLKEVMQDVALLRGMKSSEIRSTLDFLLNKHKNWIVDVGYIHHQVLHHFSVLLRYLDMYESDEHFMQVMSLGSKERMISDGLYDLVANIQLAIMDWVDSAKNDEVETLAYPVGFIDYDGVYKLLSNALPPNKELVQNSRMDDNKIIREFLTVQMGGPRQSGKSSWIANKVKEISDSETFTCYLVFSRFPEFFKIGGSYSKNTWIGNFSIAEIQKLSDALLRGEIKTTISPKGFIEGNIVVFVDDASFISYSVFEKLFLQLFQAVNRDTSRIRFVMVG